MPKNVNGPERDLETEDDACSDLEFEAVLSQLRQWGKLHVVGLAEAPEGEVILLCEGGARGRKLVRVREDPQGPGGISLDIMDLASPS